MPTESELYLEISNLRSVRYVRPEPALIGTRLTTQRYSNMDGLVAIDDSADLVTIYKFLKPPSLNRQWARQQVERLEREGFSYAKEKLIRDLRGDLRNLIFNHKIWAELLDWRPEKRKLGYQLPQGANATLYRQWKVKGDYIDPDGLTPIPVKWNRGSGKISREMRNVLGVPIGVSVQMHTGYVQPGCDRVTALRWTFSEDCWEPVLESDVDPRRSSMIKNPILLLGKKD